MTPDEAVENITSTLGGQYDARLRRDDALELRRFLRSGYQRALDRGDVERFDFEVGVLARELASAAYLARSVGESGGDAVTEVVISGGLGDALRKLCPIWPFC